MPVTIDIYYGTNALEQLRWHGQKIPPDSLGARLLHRLPQRARQVRRSLVEGDQLGLRSGQPRIGHSKSRIFL
jgi:hypothetical protein